MLPRFSHVAPVPDSRAARRAISAKGVVMIDRKGSGPHRARHAASASWRRRRGRPDIPPLRLGDRRRDGNASLRQGARAQGARLQDEMAPACAHAAARHRSARGWRLPDSRQGQRRSGPGSAHHDAAPGSAVARGFRGALERRPCPDGAPRLAVGSFAALRHHLVPGRGPQISPASRARCSPPRCSCSSSRS